MKTAATFLVVSILFGLCCESAEARFIRQMYWYDADAVGRQERATMAERTHQQKELMEAQRLNKERERISAASTVKNYQLKPDKKKVRDANAALVYRQRRNAKQVSPQSQL